MNPSERIPVGTNVVIYRRGNKGTFCADYWQEGQHRRRSLRTANLKVAIERATKLSANLSDGTVAKPFTSTSIAEAIESFISFLETEHRAKKTRTKYSGVLTNFAAVLYQCGVKRMDRITVTHFDAFRTARHALKRHPYTRYNEGVILKQFLKWAKSRRLIADNPLAEVRLPKPIRDRHPAVEFTEVNQILAVMPAHRATAIAMLAFAGLRAGEMQRLQRTTDVDLRRGWVDVRSRDGLETKTRQSRRIPIHSRLKSYLKQIEPSSSAWLFTEPGTGGSPINIRKLNAEFQAVAKQLGMNVGRKQLGYTLHSLRHFFETFCVNARIPQRVVDQWMGHTGDRSMAAMYYQLSPDESQRFMNEVPFGADNEAA